MSFPDSPHLVKGSGTQIGIITLWTKKEHVLEHLKKDTYAVCSQLYSRDEGISQLVRSLLAHPEIRDIVMVGTDLNACSDTLLALWEQGVDNGMVKGAPGYVDTEIPSDAIDMIRNNVTIHDQRGLKDYTLLPEVIARITKKSPWGEAQSYPSAKITPPTFFPAAPFHTIRSTNTQEATIHIAHKIQRFGPLLNVSVQVSKSNNTKEESLEEDYYTNLVQSKKGTYGEAIATQGGWNALLTADYASIPVGEPLQRVGVNNAGHNTHLYAVTGILTLTELAMLTQALFRILHEHQRTGTVTIFASKIIASKESLQPLLERRLAIKKIGDPASNFLIRLENGQIVITHLSPEGKRLEIFSGTKAEKLYLKIISESRVSDLSHAAYLGYELAKAENALQTGGWYEQDATVRPN